MAETSASSTKTSSPRVLWIIPTLSSRFGGPTTTAVNGVVAERQEGLTSEIATTISRDGLGDSQTAFDRLKAGRVPVHGFSRFGRSRSSETWGLSPAMAFWMIRNLSSFDVVHLQYVWCMTSFLGCLFAKLHGIPVVVTPHESLTVYDINIASRGRLKRISKKVLKQFYLKTVDRIIFMSKLEERDTEAGDRRTVRISHAVAQQTSPGERDASNPWPGPLRIGFLGRNIPKKGIDRLIQSLARDPEEEWRLHVAGPPGTDEFITDMHNLAQSLGVDKRVEWLGFLDEKPSLFNRCDVLAMPSAYEGFGMVAAEAMSHGLPVIVPRRSGVAEIVNEYEAGIVIDEPCVEDLTAALARFDSERENWSAFSANGLRAVQERLTFEAFASSTRVLYDSLA